MNVNDILKNVLETSIAVEFTNEIVWAILQSSRETCIEMREQLEAERDRNGIWSTPEADDWESLVLDIAAFNRVIDYYGG